MTMKSNPAAEAPRITTQVLVMDLRIEALIGILGHEIGQTQPLHVDVVLDVQTVAKDDLSEAFDYRHVATRAEALGAQQIALIESFAKALALSLLDHPHVTAAEVTLRKPHALQNGMASTRVRAVRPD